MNEHDSALVGAIETEIAQGRGSLWEKALCRIIRELEADRDQADRSALSWKRACEMADDNARIANALVREVEQRVRDKTAGWSDAVDRWRHAGRTIRRYRDWWVQTQGALDIIADIMHRYHRRWQWEKRRAERYSMYKAISDNWSQAANRERRYRYLAQSEATKLARELLDCRAERNSARAALADAKADGAHQVLEHLETAPGLGMDAGAIYAEMAKLRARYPRKEAKT